MFSFKATSSSTASSPIASESPGMPIASGKPNIRISVEPSSFDAASTQRLKCDSRMHTLMEEQRGDPSHKKKDSEDSDNPAVGTWCYKGELVAQNNKAWEKPLAHGVSSSVDQEESKEHGSDMGPLPPNIAGHIALQGSSLLHGQPDLWKTTRRSYGKICLWIWLFGDCSWIPLFKQQVISEKTMTRIHITRRTISGTLGEIFCEIIRLICELSENLGPKTP